MYKCSTAAEGTRPRLENTQLIVVRLPKAVSTRNTAVLMASNQITALVNGGKLNVISLPIRRTKFLSYTLLLPSALGCGHYRQTPVTFIINRPHAEYHIIFRDLQSRPRRLPEILRMLPFRAAGGAPHDLVAAGSRHGFPRKRG